MDANKFSTVTSEGFRAALEAHFSGPDFAKALASVDWDLWLHRRATQAPCRCSFFPGHLVPNSPPHVSLSPGMPPEVNHYDTRLGERAFQLAERQVAAAAAAMPWRCMLIGCPM